MQFERFSHERRPELVEKVGKSSVWILSVRRATISNFFQRWLQASFWKRIGKIYFLFIVLENGCFESKEQQNKQYCDHNWQGNACFEINGHWWAANQGDDI